MFNRIHLVAGVLAPLSIAVFWLTTVLVELFGSHAAVARAKALIVTPGLWLLVPALAAAGISGVRLSMSRKGRLAEAKKKRMPFIAANGLLVLVPCALLLSGWAAEGRFDAGFYALQAVELAFGAVNFVLMGLNVRDGLRMAGRLPGRRSVVQRPS